MIQRRIKSIYDLCATDYFTKEGFVFSVEQGYNEGQLKRLCQHFKNADFKSLNTLISISKEYKKTKTYQNYGIEEAIDFIKNKMNISPVDYFIKEGVFHSNAKIIEDLENNSKFTYEFEDYILPDKEEISGFKTYWEKCSNGGYMPFGNFSNCIFKGFTSEIVALSDFIKKELSSLNILFPFYIENAEIVNMSILRCGDFYDAPFIEKAIKNFPQLKFIGFYKKYDYHNIYTVYSESGYAYLTDSKCIGPFDYKADSTWDRCHSPDKDFNDSFIGLNTGCEEKIKYKCPFKKQWNDINYVRFDGDNIKIVSNRSEVIAQSKINNELIDKCRYPIRLSFYLKDNSKITVGEKLHFKVIKLPYYDDNTIQIINEKDNIIGQFSDIDISYQYFYRDWQSSPFNYSCYGVFDALCKDVDDLLITVNKVDVYNDGTFVTLDILLQDN